jgi:hypothetical protein
MLVESMVTGGNAPIRSQKRAWEGLRSGIGGHVAWGRAIYSLQWVVGLPGSAPTHRTSITIVHRGAVDQISHHTGWRGAWQSVNSNSIRKILQILW